LQAWDGLWLAVKSVLEGMWGQIMAVVDNFPSDMMAAGVDMVRGLWEGIKSMGSWLADKVGGFVRDNVPGPIKSVLGIQSPSKVAAELGRMVPLGLAVGMDSEAPSVESAAERLASASLPTVSAVRSGLASVVPIGEARSAGGLFDGATFVQQGTPEELARKTARQIGLEVRAS
jgi:phage-related protein